MNQEKCTGKNGDRTGSIQTASAEGLQCLSKDASAQKKWNYLLITMRDDCAEGKIMLEEYSQSMEDEFNLTRKTPPD